jgi:hypothetical protein
MHTTAELRALFSADICCGDPHGTISVAAHDWPTEDQDWVYNSYNSDGVWIASSCTFEAARWALTEGA